MKAGNGQGAPHRAGWGLQNGTGFPQQCLTCTSLARGTACDKPVTAPYCWLQRGQGEAVGGETEQMARAAAASATAVLLIRLMPG